VGKIEKAIEREYGREEGMGRGSAVYTVKRAL